MKCKFNIAFQLDDDRLETLEQSGIDVYMNFKNKNTFMHLKNGLATICNDVADLINDTNVEGDASNETK